MPVKVKKFADDRAWEMLAPIALSPRGSLKVLAGPNELAFCLAPCYWTFPETPGALIDGWQSSIS